MSRKIQIYNTLTRKKEIFNPIVENHVGMYVCGPTVYGDPHLGHARPSITFDVVFRYLKHSDYKVRYVRNITDAGHLENDADEGEDKIAKKARLEQLEPMEIVQFYTISYHKAMDALNCLPPSIEPRATGHIIEQIEMVQKILKNGFAYEVNSSVYLDVNKYNESYPYGTLSGRNIEDTLEGTRALDGQSEKKSSVDFAIWKKANPEHIMRWDSPWGEGFPGWHMECSAMSEKYLGKNFDIHGGGMDLVFPHHEAEIAQSNACNNCNPVNYWMHNNMITIDGKKMGKSLGNFINLEEFFNGTHAKLDRAYSPMTIRFFILQAQYRSTVDFGNEALQAAEKGFTKLMNAMETLENLKNSDSSTYDINELEKNCYAAMDDDFNTPILIAHLFDGVRIINSVKDGKESLTASDLSKMQKLFSDFVTDILGLISPKESGGNDLTEEVMELV
ncbi:MAG: cysteine--tRNA ligase, partial [Flavobacteriales bacterium]|nr:cysteine--tRNA ligase [Flavobacteriales bacterium]